MDKISSKIRYLLLPMVFLLSCQNLKSQTLNPDSLMDKMEQLGHYLLYKNHDTSYISNYGDDLILKLIAVNKFNYFKVKDKDQNSSIRYRPDRRLNLGLGVSYKWFAIDLAFNFGIGEDSDFKNSKSFDFQGNIFSSKQFISATLQYYYGFKMHNYKGNSVFENPPSSSRDDIRTVSFGLQYLFAFNYDKFSLKASFIQNEIQRKSAGSLLTGAGFNIYTMDSDSSVVPIEVQDSFDEKLHLNGINSISLSIYGGYMYTFVWKENFYATVSLIPGLGLSMGDFQTQYREPFDTHLFMSLTTMNSIGYNSRKIFGGIQLLGDIYNIRIDQKLKTEVGRGKTKLFIGYRFGQS